MTLGIVTNLCIGAFIVVLVVFACILATSNPNRPRPHSTKGWDNGRVRYIK